MSPAPNSAAVQNVSLAVWVGLGVAEGGFLIGTCLGQLLMSFADLPSRYCSHPARWRNSETIVPVIQLVGPDTQPPRRASVVVVIKTLQKSGATTKRPGEQDIGVSVVSDPDPGRSG